MLAATEALGAVEDGGEAEKQRPVARVLAMVADGHEARVLAGTSWRRRWLRTD
jgi:hypothetical protein